MKQAFGNRFTTRAALDAQVVEPGQIFTDKVSGAVNTDRPAGLAALPHYAREGDTVVVTATDRLGRSVAEVTRHYGPLRGYRMMTRGVLGRGTSACR